MTTGALGTAPPGDRRALAVYAALVIATVASYLMGAEEAIENPNVAAALVIVVAFVKVRLVVLHFMELAAAPMPLRLIVEAYCLLVPLALILLYLLV